MSQDESDAVLSLKTSTPDPLIVKRAIPFAPPQRIPSRAGTSFYRQERGGKSVRKDAAPNRAITGRYSWVPTLKILRCLSTATHVDLIPVLASGEVQYKHD